MYKNLSKFEKQANLNKKASSLKTFSGSLISK